MATPQVFATRAVLNSKALGASAPRTDARASTIVPVGKAWSHLVIVSDSALPKSAAAAPTSMVQIHVYALVRENKRLHCTYQGGEWYGHDYQHQRDDDVGQGNRCSRRLSASLPIRFRPAIFRRVVANASSLQIADRANNIVLRALAALAAAGVTDDDAGHERHTFSRHVRH